MNATTIADIQNEIINEFNYLNNWLDRYEYIIELGRKLPDFPATLQTEANRVYGCQSQVWFYPRVVASKLYFDATSDAAIVKGLIAILLKIYSGRMAQEILATKPDFISAIGLDKHLSQTRSNGLHHILKKIGESAKQCQ